MAAMAVSVFDSVHYIMCYPEARSMKLQHKLFGLCGHLVWAV